MEITNIYLSKDEFRAVQMLADEKSYPAIRRECIPKDGVCPANGLPLFLTGIRKKTGIENTRNPEEVKAYLHNFTESLKTPPTDEHLSVLKRMVGITHDAHTIESLANNTGRSLEEAEQAWEEALRAIGIFAKDKSARQVQARLYFASRAPFVEPVEPITPKQWKALRMHANGASYNQIAEEMGFLRELYARQMVKNIYRKLGICARGRGVQQKLARAAIAFEDSKQITMDDPAF